MTTKASLADLVLKIARSQVGVAESTHHNDGPPSLRYMGGRKEPWCGWFVAYCFREAGAPLPGDYGKPDGRASALAGVAHMQSVFKKQGWLVTTPQPGDVVFFGERMGSDVGPGHHVGLIDAVTPTLITTIEGNTGDKVASIKYLPKTMAAKAIGFGRVPQPK